jgi:WD40 repeat protein/energy-coupling factor transporter ATP-binding protein EcfA2
MSQSTEEIQGTTSTLDTANPFPGLRPFKIEESHLFFGREGQSDEVLLKLSKSRFVGVIGPSGSGKSSFIYCGVLPILYGGFLTDSSPSWEVVVTRPGAGPIDNLAEALLKTSREYTGADVEDKKIKRTIVSTLLRSSSLGLVEAIQQSRRSEDVNYLILVDQFEELFRFKDSTDPNSVNETLAFVNLLMEAVNYTDSPIYVAITMRSDFIGDCAQFPELTRKINDSHYLIPQMTRDQKRRAVEGPVAVGGANIAPRLVQQLLNDLGDNPDQLPILQHALMRTWSYWKAFKDYDEEPVDLKHYEAIGTMAEALSQHANEAFDELDDDQKRICEVIFKAITEKRGENFGIRRPTRLNEIASIADVSENDVIDVLEKFREPGRSLLTPAHGVALTSKSMVDISHESLMRIWVRLKNWVDDEAEAVQMYLRLAEAASMYQVGKSGLWRPPDLQLALNWQIKHKPTLVWGGRYHPAFERTLIFLEYSKKEFETEQRIKELEAKRKLRNARIMAGVMGGFTIVALIALVFAIYQQTVATKLKVEALASAAEAIKQGEIAKANEKEANIQKEAAVAAQKEADIQKVKAQESAIEANIQKGIAVEQSALAIKNAAIAKQNEAKATESEKVAKLNEQKALKAEADALAKTYLATAKSMALKSQELGNDPELEAIVAQQAYNFHTKYNGYKQDNDIYRGLYYALKNQKPDPHPLTRSLAAHTNGAARALATHLPNNHIYSGGSDGKIIQWNFVSGSWVAKEIVPDRSKTQEWYQVYSMDVSPDGNFLVAAGLLSSSALNNYVELYDLRNPGAPAKKIYGFVQAVENVQFTPDGKGFYARDNAGRSIKYSDLSTAKEVIKPAEKIVAIDLSADGKKIAGIGDGGNLIIWATSNFAASTYKMPTNQLTAVSFNPDASLVVVGNGNGRVWIYTSSGTQLRELAGHTGAIEQIKYNHAGTSMVTASKDYSIRLWNVKELNQAPTLLSEHDWVWSVAFSPDDEQLIAGINTVKENINTPTDQTIHAYPTIVTEMANLLGAYTKRNMTQDEWTNYAQGVDYEKTFDNYPTGK